MIKSYTIKGFLGIAAYAVFLLLTFNLKVVDALAVYASKEGSEKYEVREPKYTMSVLYSESKDTGDALENSDREPMPVKTEPLRVEVSAKPTINKKAGPSALDYINAIKDSKWEYAELIGRYIVRYDSDTYIVLTLRPDMQEMLEATLAKYSARLSVGVIQDPFTGEILAMSSSNRNAVVHVLDEEFKKDNWALQANFPVASIFKIVTAAAGMDTGVFNQNSNYLSSKKQYMKVWKAFALSHNGVFGRMARQVTIDSLEKYALLFGFNRPFFFDLPVSKSIAEFPKQQTQIEEAAAGLNKNFLVSPIHVSSMISTVINQGVALKPFLVDYVVRNNKVVFKRKPFTLAKPIKPETASLITQMMYGTTAVGTAKKGFGGYKTCPNLAKLSGGKTGTLTGSYPNYLYTWFGGFTKVSGKTLAITTLVGQSNHSATKAPTIAGQIAFELYKTANSEQKQHLASQ